MGRKKHERKRAQVLSQPPAKACRPGCHPSGRYLVVALQLGAEGTRLDGVPGLPRRQHRVDRDLPMASWTPKRAGDAGAPGAHPQAKSPQWPTDKLSGPPPTSLLRPSLPACSAAATLASPGPQCLEAGQRCTPDVPSLALAWLEPHHHHPGSGEDPTSCPTPSSWQEGDSPSLQSTLVWPLQPACTHTNTHTHMLY